MAKCRSDYLVYKGTAMALSNGFHQVVQRAYIHLSQINTTKSYNLSYKMTGKVYFITGANRGIGFALTQVLAADPSSTVLASARDPSDATELQRLAEKGNVHIIKLDVSSRESIEALDSQLSVCASGGIDYFISNAGICKHTEVMMNVSEVKADSWVEHFTTNTLGSILVTQKVIPYLKKRETKVIWFTSSMLGSTSNFLNMDTSAYGVSKAALNHFSRQLAFNLGPEGFIVDAIHPGVVATDLADSGRDAAVAKGDDEMVQAFDSLSISPEECATALVKILKGLTKEDSSKFLSYTGEEIPW